MEGHLDLAVLPLVDLERPLVPDRHRAGAVLALGDLALELEVLERVILGPDRKPILGRIGWDSVWDRPGGQRAVVLEPQVPVKPGGVMLLDDKAREGVARRLRFARAGRLRGGFEVPLLAIGLKLLAGH